MVFIVGFILAFVFYQLLTSLTNFLFKQPLIHGDYFDELISVLIPARNEEKNIANILNDLQNQTYDNIEILVFNDQSEDNTEQIIREFAERDKRIKLINSTHLPNDWLGKNFACYSLAKQANGRYLLFLDADVRIESELIRKTVTFSKRHKTGLLSIFPLQIMNTQGEKMTVPLMHYILLTLLPLILVRKSPFVSHSAANGQFMLFEANNYKKFDPHMKMKNEKVEDIKISQYYKSNKIPVACITGTDLIKCRMYSSYNEAINGFSKNIVMFFGNSAVMAVCFWLIVTFGFIPVLIYSVNLFFIYLAAFLLSKIFFSLAAKQNIFDNLKYFVPQQIAMITMIYNSFKKKKTWKGRNI